MAKELEKYAKNGRKKSVVFNYSDYCNESREITSSNLGKSTKPANTKRIKMYKRTSAQTTIIKFFHHHLIIPVQRVMVVRPQPVRIAHTEQAHKGIELI